MEPKITLAEMVSGELADNETIMFNRMREPFYKIAERIDPGVREVEYECGMRFLFSDGSEIFCDLNYWTMKSPVIRLGIARP